jgi:plastocyanin
MRIRLAVLVALLLSATQLLAQNERWILISGTVGVFHTDARVFNPSYDKDIQVTARFLPAGPNPTDNTAAFNAAGSSFTVPKRSMHVLNDVTSALFNSTSLGAILFTSADPYEVSSRIYAQTANGTLGQFGPGLPITEAKSKGALLQMKLNGSAGQIGTFRTNVGILNPNPTPTNVSWRLYDRNNALGGVGEITVPPFGVTTPILMNSTFFWDQINAGIDLSDSWVSFVSDQPVFAYASVLDNGTTDQTFVPAVDDVGVAPPPEPEPNTHTFDVELEDFSIRFSPSPQGIHAGDTVVLRIRRLNGLHGFEMVAPNGNAVVPDVRPGTSPIERSFTATAAGTYTYFCTVTTCGIGHASMFGTVNVGGEDDDGGGRPGY